VVHFKLSLFVSNISQEYFFLKFFKISEKNLFYLEKSSRPQWLLITQILAPTLKKRSHKYFESIRKHPSCREAV